MIKPIINNNQISHDKEIETMNMCLKEITAADKIEFNAGYYEYNLYVNGEQVASMGDLGEIASDWKSLDDIRDFADDMGRYAGDGENNIFENWDEKYTVSEGGKNAITEAVLKEMENRYGHNLPEHAPTNDSGPSLVD